MLKLLAVTSLLSCSMFGDTKLEEELRQKLDASEVARLAVVHSNAVMATTNASLIEHLRKIALDAGKAAQISEDEKTAIKTQQGESTQTLSNTNQVVQSQTEAEKQLIRIEEDTKLTVMRLTRATEVSVILVILVVCLGGRAVYARGKVPHHCSHCLNYVERKDVQGE